MKTWMLILSSALICASIVGCTNRFSRVEVHPSGAAEATTMRATPTDSDEKTVTVLDDKGVSLVIERVDIVGVELPPSSSGYISIPVGAVMTLVGAGVLIFADDGDLVAVPAVLSLVGGVPTLTFGIIAAVRQGTIHEEAGEHWQVAAPDGVSLRVGVGF